MRRLLNMYISRKKRNAVQANQNSVSRVSLGESKNNKESTSPILELRNWTREDVFNKGYSSRPLEDFTDPCPQVNWVTDNPLLNYSREELIALVKGEVKWRYHHGVAEIPSTTGFY